MMTFLLRRNLCFTKMLLKTFCLGLLSMDARTHFAAWRQNGAEHALIEYWETGEEMDAGREARRGAPVKGLMPMFTICARENCRQMSTKDLGR